MKSEIRLIRLVVGLAALAALVISTSSCGYYRKVRAKVELNDGATAYKNGKFPEAARHFANARDINPDNKQAYLFYALSLNAQAENAGVGEKQKKLSEQAIKAFEEAKEKDPDNDTIYAFIANRYKKDEQPAEQKKWLIMRANLPNASRDVKRDVYYSLGVDKWTESYQITTRWLDKTKGPNNAQDPYYLSYIRTDIPAEDKAKAEAATKEALENIHKAIALDPDYANAYSYLALLDREEAKLTDKQADKAKYLEDYKRDATKTQELNKKAAAAQATQQPPAS